jgi:hypothetical protein
MFHRYTYTRSSVDARKCSSDFFPPFCCSSKLSGKDQQQQQQQKQQQQVYGLFLQIDTSIWLLLLRLLKKNKDMRMIHRMPEWH